MIRQIRTRFIRIALGTLTLAMVFVAVVINAANWISVRQEMEDSLTLIVMNDGRLNFDTPQDGTPDQKTKPAKDARPRESIYETRYFSILYTAQGDYLVHDMAHIASYTQEDAIALARRALESGRTSGFLDTFLFTVQARGDSQILVFLDCESKLANIESLLWLSGLACLIGIVLAILIVSLLSSRAIRPLIENAEKQKQFITDAGHELKTPLTVISANMDVLQMDIGANEWVQSTQKQVGTMRSLVNELVFLSRMDEENSHLLEQRFDLTAAVTDTAAPFAAMAEFAGKTFRIAAQADLFFCGDEGAMRRLVSVLCDNAVKYAPEGDAITVRLYGEGKKLLLTTENRLKEPMEERTLRHLFDRFYRADSARAKTDERGGYGIGLAIAKAIVEKQHGKITACCDQGKIRFVCTWNL